MKSPNKHQLITARLVDANEWGILPAILLSYIRFWTEKNEKRRINFSKKHSQCLTRITYRRLEKLFPYTSFSSIRRALTRLEKEGIIIKDVEPFPGIGGSCLALGITDKYDQWFKNLKKTQADCFKLNTQAIPN